MKTVLLLFTVLGFHAHVRAQSGLNTTGNTATKSGNIYFTYSVGETVAFSNSCANTPGVVQPTCRCKGPFVGVFEEKYHAKFYPNPAHTHFIVETDFPGLSSYTISSVDGKVLAAGKFDYSPINVGMLAAGIYFLKLTDADNQFFKTFKLIKQ